MSIVCTELKPAPADRGEILRYSGVKTPDEGTCGILDDMLAMTEGRLEYRLCYDIFDIKRQGTTLDLTFSKTESKLASRMLEGYERVAVFAATVGIELDRLISKYSRTSPARAVMLQAIGAERIEALCDAFCDMLREKYGRERVGCRFSAGYGDLPLSLQKEIFSALNCPTKIGLHLNDSLLMSPTKSVSALVGIKIG